jgi:hypothetical protein
MTVDTHLGADVKIHYVEIDGVHDQHLSRCNTTRSEDQFMTPISRYSQIWVAIKLIQ